MEVQYKHTDVYGFDFAYVFSSFRSWDSFDKQLNFLFPSKLCLQSVCVSDVFLCDGVLLHCQEAYLVPQETVSSGDVSPEVSHVQPLPGPHGHDFALYPCHMCLSVSL